MDLSRLKAIDEWTWTLPKAAGETRGEILLYGGVELVRHMDEKVLEQIPTEMRNLLKDATATVNGQSFKACWVADAQAAHLVYEDGDQGLVPLSELHKPG